MSNTMVTYMQVLLQMMHWLRLWAQFQKDEDDIIKIACRRLETMSIQIFAHFG
jgi:hypothetical protein